LVEVDGPVGTVRSVQNTNRRSATNFRDAGLFPGSKLVAVLAPRAGTSTCVARVPDRPVPKLDLHGVGGQVGLIDPATRNSSLYAGPATIVTVLAALGDAEGRPMNMRRFGLDVPSEPRVRGPSDPRLVLVVGSDMDAGKTTTARRVIYSLRAMGHAVAAGKATGVGSLFDIASMFDAGATEVIDFAALGEPVTIGLSVDEVRNIFHKVFNHLRDSVGSGGYVVIELADGIWYRETRALMEDSAICDLVNDVVFACHSILDAENGLALLSQMGYGSKVRALSGKFGSSGLLRGLAPSLVGPLPVFDSMDYTSSPASVAALFEGEAKKASRADG